jgi:hypothetical protein
VFSLFYSPSTINESVFFIYHPYTAYLLYTELAAVSIVENQKRPCQLIRTVKRIEPEGGSVVIQGTESSRGLKVEGVGSDVGSDDGSDVG